MNLLSHHTRRGKASEKLLLGRTFPDARLESSQCLIAQQNSYRPLYNHFFFVANPSYTNSLSLKLHVNSFNRFHEIVFALRLMWVPLKQGFSGFRRISKLISQPTDLAEFQLSLAPWLILNSPMILISEKNRHGRKRQGHRGTQVAPLLPSERRAPGRGLHLLRPYLALVRISRGPHHCHEGRRQFRR